jgi:AraC family transcriptional activator of mtrCDE
MMHTDHDSLIDWLLKSLELDTTLFHLGQYCGAWRASTTGLASAGFHLVLHGACWLHLHDEDRSVALSEGDCVFFLRDVPHTLTPTPDIGPDLPPAGAVPMGPIDKSVPDAVALACGFFGFRAGFTQALMHSFPSYVVIPAHGGSLHPIRPLFDLVLAEADRDSPTPSPLVARLVDLMFYYVVRELAARADVVAGIWAVLAAPEFLPLLKALIDDPGREWTVDAMAGITHMARATFFKRFVRTAGVAPAQFLALLRMQLAARMLATGTSIARAAEQVGYQSDAAFSRAFKKATGVLPGAYRRARTDPLESPALPADRTRGRMNKESRQPRVASAPSLVDNSSF